MGGWPLIRLQYREQGDRGTREEAEREKEIEREGMNERRG